MEIDLTEILVLHWGRFLVAVVAVTEEEGQRRSRPHLVVIFLADVVNGNIITTRLLHLVFRKIGMLKKDGIDLETEIGLREMSLREVRVGITMVNEISLLEVRSIFSLIGQ